MKPMNFGLCKKHYLKHIEVDYDKIKSILNMAKNRFDFIKQIKNKDKYVSIICENYYEIIKELLIAVLLKYELKSRNHECLISFFKYKFSKYEYESMIIYQLKNKRNLLHYEGKTIDQKYLLTNEHEFLKIINILKKLINSQQLHLINNINSKK